MTSKFKDFLLKALVHLQDSNQRIEYLAFTRADELKLYEFIHPCVSTRDASFRIFNLPVHWDSDSTCMIDQYGKKFVLDFVNHKINGDFPGELKCNSTSPQKIDYSRI